MEKDSPTCPLIFVGGAPRSGTTLVQRILGCHSAIYAGPEFDLVPEIMRLRSQFLAEIESGRISIYLSNQEANALFEKFVLSLFQKTLAEKGKAYLSEKTPSNVAVFPELQACMPSARFIFVMRDPRAIVASMLEVGRRYRRDGKPAPTFVKNTRRAIEYINLLWKSGNRALINDINIQLVYYEDIVNDARTSISAMTDFLGVPFEEALIDIQNSVWDTSEFKAGENYWYTKEQLKTGIEKDRLQDWTTTLSNYDLYVIDRNLIRIPGLTDRYHLEVSGSLISALRNVVGTLFANARGHLVAKYRKFSRAR